MWIYAGTIFDLYLTTFDRHLTSQRISSGSLFQFQFQFCNHKLERFACRYHSIEVLLRR